MRSKELKIIKNYGLDYYLKILLTKNNANHNPYHNFYHSTTVMSNCYDIAVSQHMNFDRIKLILTAALFHDFNHSGGKLSDDLNVKEAIKQYLEYSQETDEYDEKFVVSLIRCTQFPYDKEYDKTLSEYQKIIRDSDVLQWVEANFIQQIMLGINKEFGNELITIKALENQIKFMESIEIFTEFGKEKYDEMIDGRIEDCEYLIKVLR